MFRFTIRDVLWVTVVVGLGAAWWLDHSRTAKWLGEQKDWRELEICGSRHAQRMQRMLRAESKP
jgi:hypothetical protein